jgi:hypothetical protein
VCSERFLTGQFAERCILTHTLCEERVAARLRVCRNVGEGVAEGLQVKVVVFHNEAALLRIRCCRYGLSPPSVRTWTRQPRRSSRSCSRPTISRSERPCSTSTSKSTSLLGDHRRGPPIRTRGHSVHRDGRPTTNLMPPRAEFLDQDALHDSDLWVRFVSSTDVSRASRAPQGPIALRTCGLRVHHRLRPISGIGDFEPFCSEFLSGGGRFPAASRTKLLIAKEIYELEAAGVELANWLFPQELTGFCFPLNPSIHANAPVDTRIAHVDPTHDERGVELSTPELPLLAATEAVRSAMR